MEGGQVAEAMRYDEMGCRQDQEREEVVPERAVLRVAVILRVSQSLQKSKRTTALPNIQPFDSLGANER